jgi:hypothetical protein
MNYYNITSNDLVYTVDDSPLKNNKYIPCVNIPIKNREYFLNNLPKVVIVLAWNFFNVIKTNNQDLIDKGLIFINIKDLEKSDFTV